MFTVRVLGELAIERDGVAVDLPAGRPARALLGLLALERGAHSRSALAVRFWPDVLDDSARGSLRSALSALKRALEPDPDRYVLATRERVGLHDEVWTDARAFDQLVRDGRLQDAMELYRGDLLTGFDDDWVLGARDEWRERAGAVLGRLADEADAAGDRARAIAHTRRIVALDPLGEEGQRALIGRLADAGDRPAALAAYGRYADRLRTELRIAPSGATRALVEGLRGDDDAGAAPTPRAAAPAAGTVTLLFTDLVGSTELLAELGDDEAERLRRDHFGLLRDVALDHAGEEVKSLGDGLMVAFASSLDAVGCAVGIQQAVDRYNRRTGSERLRVRVGLNVGEPIRDEDDYFGTPVVVAKRLCDRAEGGQILASELVRMLIGGRGGHAFSPVGDLALKGLATPVATSEVLWEPTTQQRIPLPAQLAPAEGAFVGRDAEAAALQDAWRRAGPGRLGVAMVAGEPGVGKTRLVAEFARGAHADGATVLLGRCHEAALVPYGPFTEALRRYVAECPPDELRLQLGPRRRLLARLVPELAAGGEVAESGADRHALFDAVAAVLSEIARTRPAVLVLDDLQWADEASLLLLRHLVHAAPEVPLLVVGTYRATELHEDGPLSAALAELRRARVLDAVALGGLDRDAVAAMVRGLRGHTPEDVAASVAHRTEGNPFFVEEIVRHLDAGGSPALPQSVDDLLRRRLRRLGDPGRQVVAAAAVLGREFGVDALERIVTGGPEDLLEALDEALDEHVLVAVPGVAGRLAFAHALIRETVYEQLSPARRPLLHRRAADALEHLHATRLDEHADELAHHRLQAGDDAGALDHQLRAARAAQRVYAMETALAHYGAALETAARLGLTPGDDERLGRAWVERGWLREMAGDFDAAGADYGHALAAGRVAGDLTLQAHALDRLAFSQKTFDAALSEAHHQRALAIAGELGDTPLRIGILSRMGLTRAGNLDLAGALDAAAQAQALASETGDDHDLALAIDAAKLTALLLGDLERLDALTAQLAEIHRRHGDHFYLEWAVLESAFVPLAAADHDAAEARLAEALDVHGRVGDALFPPLLHDARSWLRRSRGDLGGALFEGRQAVARGERLPRAAWRAWTRATLGWALLGLRAGAEAVLVLERGLADAAAATDRYRAAAHLAWAQVLAGDPAAAARATADAEESLARLRAPVHGTFVFGFGATGALARAQLAGGDAARAQAILEPLLAAASRSGWHEATASASLVLGLCHEARGDEPAARASLAVAAHLADRHGLPCVGWEASAALARLSPAAEAARLREDSARVARAIAGTVEDDGLVAAFIAAADG